MTPPAPLYVLRLTDPHWEGSTSLHRTTGEVRETIAGVCEDAGYAYDVWQPEVALRDRGWTVEIEEIACPSWIRVVS